MRRAFAWISTLLAMLTVGCAALPSLEGRTDTTAFINTGDTRLGRAVVSRTSANPGLAGIHVLSVPGDAFAARALLANAADRSLDAQYYLWQGDQTGFLLFQAVWQAAERGVRVRLLIDDANTAGLDDTIAALDAHANIEVRLYNPLLNRDARGLSLVADFTRLNHRMHNKAFIADNQVAIVGGRNIANEYLGAGDAVVFADVDVIAVGPVVHDVSNAFDLYWRSRSAYPAGSILPGPGVDARERLRARFETVRGDSQSIRYLEALRDTPILAELLEGRLSLEWTNATLLRDDPAKTLDAAGSTDVLLLPQLLRTIGRPDKTFDLVSPYFVPGEDGTAALVALAQGGVKVRVLTNSLAATDVVAVHAGYAKRRRALLQAGIQLFELKTSAATDAPQEKQKFGIGSSSSLHAKTFAVDGARVFVGSFNFDQRSAFLNTEMGLVLESPAIAGRLAAEFDSTVPKVAYEVRLTQDDKLVWVDRRPDGVIYLEVEPTTEPIKRYLVEFLSVLPIEWLL